MEVCKDPVVAVEELIALEHVIGKGSDKNSSCLGSSYRAFQAREYRASWDHLGANAFRTSVAADLPWDPLGHTSADAFAVAFESYW